MSADLSELMASNDPMATPVMSVGPPPAMPTHPSNDGMQQQPIAPLMQPPVPMTDAPKKKPNYNPMQSPEAKDAFLVTLISFIVLMPTVQRSILTQFPVLEDRTYLGLATAVLTGFAFYYAREHLSNM